MREDLLNSLRDILFYQLKKWEAEQKAEALISNITGEDFELDSDNANYDINFFCYHDHTSKFDEQSLMELFPDVFEAINKVEKR